MIVPDMCFYGHDAPVVLFAHRTIPFVVDVVVVEFVAGSEIFITFEAYVMPDGVFSVSSEGVIAIDDTLIAAAAVGDHAGVFQDYLQA